MRNMIASAAGTIDARGRNVRQKAGLNRAILLNGWSMRARYSSTRPPLADQGEVVSSPLARTTSELSLSGISIHCA